VSAEVDEHGRVVAFVEMADFDYARRVGAPPVATLTSDSD
jgi:hypothetical protein